MAQKTITRLRICLRPSIRLSPCLACPIGRTRRGLFDAPVAAVRRIITALRYRLHLMRVLSDTRRFDYYPFSLFSRQPTPFVTTLHGRLDLPEHQMIFATFPSIPVISISDAQRRPVAGAGWIRLVRWAARW